MEHQLAKNKRFEEYHFTAPAILEDAKQMRPTACEAIIRTSPR
jgi:hypothetical protein